MKKQAETPVAPKAPTTFLIKTLRVITDFDGVTHKVGTEMEMCQNHYDHFKKHKAVEKV